MPAAKSGIAAAVVLGVGRAIGEAMAVMMVAGNVANMPSLFQSVRFLTTAVASEMSYASYGSLQREALFSIALVAKYWEYECLSPSALQTFGISLTAPRL